MWASHYIATFFFIFDFISFWFAFETMRVWLGHIFGCEQLVDWGVHGASGSSISSTPSVFRCQSYRRCQLSLPNLSFTSSSNQDVWWFYYCCDCHCMCSCVCVCVANKVVFIFSYSLLLLNCVNRWICCAVLLLVCTMCLVETLVDIFSMWVADKLPTTKAYFHTDLIVMRDYN